MSPSKPRPKRPAAIPTSPADGEPTPTVTAARGTASADRAADVLLALFAEGGSAGVSHLARRVGISKAVVHRVLQSFVSRDLVAYNPETRVYRLGVAAAALGARALSQLGLRSIAMPRLAGLMERTGETATVSVLVGDRCVCIDQVVSTREVHMTVDTGRLRPLHVGASSRAILAALDDDERARILDAELPEQAPNSMIERLRLQEAIEDTRQRGAAVSFGERQPEAAAIAAPVYRLDGTVMGAISVCGPRERFTPHAIEAWLPEVRAVAEAVSEEMRRTSPFREPGAKG